MTVVVVDGYGGGGGDEWIAGYGQRADGYGDDGWMMNGRLDGDGYDCQVIRI